MGVLLIVFGCVAILGAIFGKEFFAVNVNSPTAYKQKRSTWSGRLLFALVGVFLIGIGIDLIVRSR
jgi:cytochrome c biogenesis protein ResB